jgi:hypothetical protein
MSVDPAGRLAAASQREAFGWRDLLLACIALSFAALSAGLRTFGCSLAYRFARRLPCPALSRKAHCSCVKRKSVRGGGLRFEPDATMSMSDRCQLGAPYPIPGRTAIQYPPLEGDLTGAPDTHPGWWLLEPVSQRRFLGIALPCISPGVAMRWLTSLLGNAAFALLASIIVRCLLYAFLPGAGTVILPLPVGALRLANELTLIAVASMITIRFARNGAVRRPPLYFIVLLLWVNLAATLDALLLS